MPRSTPHLPPAFKSRLDSRSNSLLVVNPAPTAPRSRTTAGTRRHSNYHHDHHDHDCHDDPPHIASFHNRLRSLLGRPGSAYPSHSKMLLFASFARPWRPLRSCLSPSFALPQRSSRFLRVLCAYLRVLCGHACPHPLCFLSVLRTSFASFALTWRPLRSCLSPSFALPQRSSRFLRVLCASLASFAVMLVPVLCASSAFFALPSRPLRFLGVLCGHACPRPLRFLSVLCGKRFSPGRRPTWHSRPHCAYTP